MEGKGENFLLGSALIYFCEELWTMVFDTLLSVGPLESITLVKTFSVEIAGPIETSVGGGIALGVKLLESYCQQAQSRTYW